MEVNLNTLLIVFSLIILMLFTIIVYLVNERNRKRDKITELKFNDLERKIDSIKALSNREVEILKEMIKGLSNKEIGENLHISIGTVKNHKNKIYHKLGTKNLIELIKMLGNG